MHPTLIIEQLNNNINHYENIKNDNNYYSVMMLIRISKARIVSLFKQLDIQQQPTTCNNKFCCEPIEKGMGIEQCVKCEKQI